MILGETPNRASASTGSTEPALLLDLASIDLSTLSKSELQDLILQGEELNRRTRADLYELCAEAERRRVPSIARHRNDALWLADELRIAKGAAGGMIKRGALLFTTHPELGEAFRAGVIRDEHITLFARVWNRPTLRPALARDVRALIDFTHNDWFTCQALFRGWEELVDPIDPNDYAARAHTDRSLTFTDPVQQQVVMEILTTTAAFSLVEPALKVLVAEMFEADWAEARNRVGIDATMADLLRTDTQRRHDALFRLLRNGIGADEATANVVTNIIVDAETLENEAERRDAVACRETTALQSLTADEALRRATSRRCESESGRAISPSDALDFAIAAKVRLFVMDARTNDFEASAKTRLFNGSKRLGVMIRDRHCQGAGCDTRAWHCDADHTIRHTDDGPTVPTNAKSRCGPCHRHKTRLELLGLWPPDW